LLSVKVSGSACITITANVSRAGATGVVMEDPDEDPPVNLPDPLCIEVVTEPPECYEGQPDYDQWELFEKPLCWCDLRQCHGNATGEPPEGGAKEGYWYVGLGDLNVLISAWKVLEPAVAPTPSGPGVLTVPNGICADFSHSAEGGAKEGYWRVGLGDLNILIANWKVLEPAVAPTPSGPGVPPDCLDVP